MRCPTIDSLPLVSARPSSGSRTMRFSTARACARESSYWEKPTRSPCAIWASALPVSESLVSENKTSATAIIGTTTMITKNRKSRERKLI